MAGKQWIWGWRTLTAMGGITAFDVVCVGSLTLLTAAMEGLGIALLLPLLDFIQHRDDPTALAAKGYWWALEWLFSVLRLPVTLLALAGVVLVVVVLRESVNYATNLFNSSLTIRVEKNIRDRIVRKMLAARIISTDALGSGAFVELVYGQSRNASTLFDQFVGLWKLIVTVGAYAVLAMLASPLASMLGTAMVTIAALSITRMVRTVRHLSTTLVDEQKSFAGWIAERYGGRRIVKLGRAEGREEQAFQKRSTMLGSLQYRIARATAQSQWLTMVILMLLALIALVAAIDVLQVSLSMVAIATLAIMRVAPLALGLNRLRQSMANRIASLERVTEVDVSLDAGDEKRAGDREFPGLREAVRLEGVKVVYPGANRAALDGVTATIPAFTMTALIGPSGAGKSTLVDLLPRLLDPTEGKVLWDGVPAETYSLSSLRRHIAFMPQQAILFDDTVAANVAYFNPEASLADIEAACRQAYAHEFIERLPLGYQTSVGEGGCQLSGGEKQRLALARALLAKADILILDEPTSAIDLESEARIQAALDNLLQARRMTLIVIAHRLSTIQKAGHVLVISDGRVVREGGAEIARAAEFLPEEFVEPERSNEADADGSPFHSQANEAI